MYRERKRRKIVFLILAIILCIMGIGYSAFYSKLRISGTTNITSNWDVKISNISSPTINGSAEEVINPSCDISGTPKLCGDGLTANMEVNLYEVGDSVEYDITITNYGSIDAKLDDYLINGETEAIKVTFTGHTKGETLFKSGSSNSSKTIHVKIEYNPEYTGGEVSEETSISFEYKQADVKELDEDEVISKDRYLVTYDCAENGGNECTSNNEYLLNNDNVDLTKQASKEGYEFIGWNTDKNATSSIQNLKVNGNTTLYAIYKKDISITYTYGNGIKNLSKNSDSCTVYNKVASCDKTLPTVTLDNDASNDYYELDGLYIEDTKIESPGSNHTYTDSVAVQVIAQPLPVMRSYSGYSQWHGGYDFTWKEGTPDFHSDSIRETITEIEFIDLDNTKLSIPNEIDNVTVWDVSAKENESVIAWLEETKLYIGGKGGVIANSHSHSLFLRFTNVISINFNNNFNTGKVKSMGSMFQRCSKLTELDLSSFDTSKVTEMTSMFSTCTSLINIDVSNFDTSKATDIRYMFGGCKSLTELNLSSFNTSNVTMTVYLFNGCANLKTIYASEDFVTTKVTNSGNEFTNDMKLVGGNGTSVADKKAYGNTYAKIDKDGQEGYFTDGSIPVITNISSVTGLNSITLTVDSYVPNGDNIEKIEYSVDGVNYYEQTDSDTAKNIYTFTGLTHNTEYTTYVKITSENNKTKIETKNISTDDLSSPTFSEEEGEKSLTVTITYPEECSSTYSCSYIKNSDVEIEVNDDTDVVFNTDGTLTAKVSDGTNTSTYTYTALVADTLYKVVRRDAIKDTIASTYDGNGSADFENTVYYYNSNSDATKSNVLFNGICWQMVRTTDTGGVKLLYNGEADENDECGTGRPNHKGYGSKGSSNLTTSYKYGSSYTLSNGTFTLNDLYTYDGTNKTDLIGKYTCRNANTSCTTLYYIEQYNSENSFVQVPINSNTTYSSVGATAYNSRNSIAYVGYMYNKVYPFSGKSANRENISNQNITLNETRFFDNEVIWNNPVQSKYSMNTPFNLSSDNFLSSIGKYAVSDNTNGATNTNTDGKYAFYIVTVSGTTGYTIKLENGQSLEDIEKYYTFGNNVTNNNDGTYTITYNNSTSKTVKRSEWYSQKNDIVVGDYVCFGQSNTCTDIYQVTYIGNNYFDYFQVGYVFGNDVDYYDGKYHLKNTTDLIIDWKDNYNNINNTHYTCLNSTGECDEVSFLYYSKPNSMSFLKLSNEVTIERALEEMLSVDDVNIKNSIIKSSVDLWYRENMINKTSYLEDTVYCNDRSISSLQGFSKTGSIIASQMMFNSDLNSLVCENFSDRFTVSPENGNGALTYPTGLLTGVESNLLGMLGRKRNYNYWINSPFKSHSTNYANDTFVRFVNSQGSISYDFLSYQYNILPVVSLKSNTEYTEGDGSYINPYKIE